MVNIKAVILMGGSGERFGSSEPKQFAMLSGQPIYLRTLKVFLDSDLFDEVLLVCHLDWLKHVQEETGQFEKVRLVEGGKTRQESSKRGVLAAGDETDIILIHDAVRPFVTKEILSDNIELARKHGAVDTAIPSSDTIISVENEMLTHIPPRASMYRGQTPQTFRYDLIKEVHASATKENASDDCQLVLEQGHRVYFTKGSEENIKITSTLDLFLAEQILRLHLETNLQLKKRNFKGKIAVVCGGTRGIGKATAELLQKLGVTVIEISRNAPEYSVDLSSLKETKAIFQKIHSKYGEIDFLVNAVGFLIVKPFKALEPDEMVQLIAYNLHPTVNACRYAQVKVGGHVVNIGSSAYSRGRKNYALYSSMKSALINFTQGLAEEHPELQINALVPSRTDTAMRKENFPDEDPSTLLSPNTVAEQIVRLLSHKTMTGSIIEVKKNPL